MEEKTNGEIHKYPTNKIFFSGMKFSPTAVILTLGRENRSDHGLQWWVSLLYTVSVHFHPKFQVDVSN